MRTTLLNHFEEAGLFDTMEEREKDALLNEIDEIQSRSKHELFQMHKDQREGKLVETNEYFKSLHDDIDKFTAKLEIVEVEFNR